MVLFHKIKLFVCKILFPIQAKYISLFRHLEISGEGLFDLVHIASCGQGNKLVLGHNVQLHNVSIKIYGNNNTIHICDNNNLNDISFVIEDSSNFICIGENAYIGGNTLLAALEGKRIDIGSNGMITGNCELRTSDSHSLLDTEGRRCNVAQDILIGNHVWIATGCTILKGVHLPDNCVVAAHSLVIGKKVYKPNTLIGGTPAKSLRENISWDIKRI